MWSKSTSNQIWLPCQVGSSYLTVRSPLYIILIWDPCIFNLYNLFQTVSSYLRRKPHQCVLRFSEQINNKNMLSAIKLAFSAIKIAFSISERVLLENFTGVSRPLEVSFLLMVSCCASCPAYFPHNLVYSASPFPGVWQSFISVKVCIPAFAPSCQKRLTGFFVRFLFFLQIKHINFKTLKDVINWIENCGNWIENCAN